MEEKKQTKKQLIDFYHSNAENLQSKINVLRSRSHGFVIGEIGSFLGIIFFIVLITLSDATVVRVIEGLLAVVMFAVYVIVRNKDVKNSDKMAELSRLHKAYQHEKAYLNGDFSAFDDGERYVDPHHPFTYDLDIFGKDSLYQRINRTVTTGGADKLANELSLTAPPLQRRGEYYAQDSKCKTIEGNISPSPLERGWGEAFWRMQFISNGVDGKIDTDVILNSVPELKRVEIPAYLGGKVLKIVAWALIIGLFASIIAAVYRLVNPLLPIFWLFFNFFVVQGIANRYLKEMTKMGSQLHKQMQSVMKLTKHIGTLKDAEVSFETLTDIVETLVLRGNDFYRFLADALGMRGLFLVSKFYHWRNMAIDDLPRWIGTITNVDVEVSKVQFACNHTNTCQATIVDAQHVVYEARGMYHPFLGEKAVRNDFTIKDRNFYIITGANMAGKSTFLRAIGVNYILAMNGMPVFADSFTVSRFKLFTSMRTSDNLAHGISYFNAELLRLKQLISRLDKSDQSGQSDLSAKLPTLIILDEILKGTNSLDKLNGSRMFLRAMEDKNVTGVIATHDLELSKMDEESPRFHNYCFEIQLGTDITYSYKITPGVARNQNATFLLKQLLKS